MAKGIFVTGTDTGVGKTVVSTAIAFLLRQRGCNVGVMKPVTSGCIQRDGRLVSEDAEVLAAGAGIKVCDEVAPYLFREPVAPSVAAEKEGTRIEFSRILAAYHRLTDNYDFMIVEGAGGLMVPLTGGLLIADLVKLLALPLLVVARPDLGTVNHTILTCFSARNLGLDVRGVVINGFPKDPGLAETTAPHMIDSLAGAPLLGRLPRIDTASPLEAARGLSLWLSGQQSSTILLREIGYE